MLRPRSDGQLVAHRRELGQVLADPQARHAGFDLLELAAVGVAGLHVERVGLRRPAGHPQQDAVPAAARVAGGLLGQKRETSRWH